MDQTNAFISHLANRKVKPLSGPLTDLTNAGLNIFTPLTHQGVFLLDSYQKEVKFGHGLAAPNESW